MTATPDWWHVWAAPEDEESPELRVSQRLGIAPLVPAAVQQRVGALCSSELQATLPENQGHVQHLVLAHLTLLQLGEPQL